jgi:hypothetical protein
LSKQIGGSRIKNHFGEKLMYMKKILIAVLLCCAITLESFAAAIDDSGTKVKLLKDSLKKDSISFNTAYLNGQYTNKQLINFGVELTNVGDRILQANVGSFQGTAISIIPTVALLRAHNSALHEIGHGLRAKSYGIDYELRLDCNDKSPFQKNENFFEYFIKKLPSIKRATCNSNYEQEAKLEKILDHDSCCNYMIIGAAGGMNNEIQLAEKISDDIYLKKKTSVYFFYCNHIMYLYNRISPCTYDYSAKEEGDDPFDIIHWFKKKGETNFKKWTICKAGLASLLLSATTYSIFLDKPLQFHGFRIPDVFAYITTKGMSYKVVSGYEIDDDLNLIFGFESTFKKPVAESTECSLGINHLTAICGKFPISYSGIVTFGQVPDFEASCSIPLSKNFSARVGCEIYSVKSLQGQRNATTNMKKDNGFSSNFFACVSYRY